MAWGWGQRKGNDSAEWTGLLERGVKFEGRLETSGTFRIDSEMKGQLLSEGTLIVGEHAVIEGEIVGKEILVAGRCDGVLRATGKVEVQHNAIVSGEVHTPCLVIEPGAAFDGHCYLPASNGVPSVVVVPVRSAANANTAKN